MRAKKRTWKDLFKDFKTQYPRISKEILGYGPYDYGQIWVKTVTGRTYIYDDFTKRATIFWSDSGQ